MLSDHNEAKGSRTDKNDVWLLWIASLNFIAAVGLLAHMGVAPVAMMILAITIIVALAVWREYRLYRSGSLVIGIALGVFLYTVPVSLWHGLLRPSTGEGLLSEAALVRYLALSLLFLIALVAALSLVPRSKGSLNSTRGLTVLNRQSARYTAVCMIVGGVVLYVAYIGIVYDGMGGMWSIDRTARFAERRGRGPFVAGLFLINFGWLYLFDSRIRRLLAQGWSGWQVYRGLWRHWLFATVYIGFFSLLGDRQIWFVLLVGFGTILSMSGVLTGKGAAGIAFVAAVVLLIFGQARFIVVNYPADRWVDLVTQNARVEWLNPARGELGSPVKVSRNIFENNTFADMPRGWSYLRAPILLMPEALWENRPRSTSELYVARELPALYRRGGGRGFSLVAESFMNFNWLGPVILGCLGALAVSAVEIILNAGMRLRELRRSVIAAGMGLMLLVPRSAVDGILKSAVHELMLPTMIFLGLWWLVGNVIARMDLSRG